MNDFKAILYWLKTQKKSRQVSLIVSLLLIGMITAYCCICLFSTHYAVLFNQLDPQDATQILKQLEQAHIPYQIKNHGSDILVDKNLVDKTRLQLMGTNMQLTGQVGFELFDKTDFGMTDFSQKINYQRALQGELERTISSLDEVRQARIHLVIPEQHLFMQEDNQPRAAVALSLSQPLTYKQVKSIQQLIAASIAHMSMHQVTVVDQNGNNLSNVDEDPLNHQLALKKSLEHYLNKKVLEMLQFIFTHQPVTVKIDVLLNYNKLQRERITPQQGGLVIHEKETQHSTSNKIPKHPMEQEHTREKSYQLGKEKEQFTQAKGQINRLTISVAVPQNTKHETVQKIERLVKSIVGFDAKRGDVISVEALIPILPHTSSSRKSILTKMNSVQSTHPTNLSFILNCFLQQYERWSIVAVLCFLLYWRHRRIRVQQRQQLLTELTQWLNQYEL